jgi:hypothetical protein
MVATPPDKRRYGHVTTIVTLGDTMVANSVKFLRLAVAKVRTECPLARRGEAFIASYQAR